MRSALLLGLVGLFLWPAVALAAGPVDHGGEPTPIPWTGVIEAIINFTIFVFLLVFLFRKPIRAYFEKRSDEIAQQLDEAARLHQEAEARLADYEQRLKSFDEEREELFANVRREAEEDRQKILSDARRQAERMERDAETAVAFEIKRAQQELREHVVDEAVRVAQRVIRERLDKATQERLIDEYASALTELRAGSAG